MYTQSERDDMERLFDKLRYVGYIFLALHLVLNFPEILEYMDEQRAFITNSIFLSIYHSSARRTGIYENIRCPRCVQRSCNSQYCS